MIARDQWQMPGKAQATQDQDFGEKMEEMCLRRREISPNGEGPIVWGKQEVPAVAVKTLARGSSVPMDTRAAGSATVDPLGPGEGIYANQERKLPICLCLKAEL